MTNINVKRPEKFRKINLLKWDNNFEKSDWQRGSTIVMTDTEADPIGKMTADKIVGTTSGDGYIRQEIKKNKGTFSFSVWLKGTGTIRIMLQENGGNFTIYKSLDVILNSKWTIYSITGIKENDGNGLLCVIGNIQNKDTVSAWRAELNELSKD